MSIEYLTLEDLLFIVEDLAVGPVRDLGLLDSAAHRPRTSLLGQDAYRSIHGKAAVLLESLTRNHALVDGNKRLSWLAIHVFYGLNGYHLVAPEDPAYDLVIAVASGQMEYPDVSQQLAAWVQPHSTQS